MTRWAFWVIAIAFVLWLALAIRAGAGAGDPTPTVSGPEPPPPPPADDSRIRHLEGELRAERLAASRARRAFRRRLRIIIHSPNLAGHWLERAFLCVHAGEGSWNAHTGNGYYGGLQMDLSFQRAYAPWALRAFGTADRWPATVQVAAAIQAWTRRGFGPWPNTARACGLR